MASGDVQLILGDCLTRMAEIDDGSVDLIAADLPYGTTQCRFDVVIPFEPLWAHYKRVLKPRGAVILTACQPFTSMLVMSNLDWFRYDLEWNKRVTTGFLNVKSAPLRSHEDILLFSKASTTYNPLMTERTPAEISRLSRIRVANAKIGTPVYGAMTYHYAPDRINNRMKYPASVIDITGRERNGVRGLHPNQKPVALMEYLIRTYSNEGDLVLDNTMGSGTTIVAAINTNRRAIGIEKDPTIFSTAERRIAALQSSTPLFQEVG